MGFPLIVADAFAVEPFRGNPAAVCFLDSARDEAWMQAVAAEMNLSETAFLVPREDGFDLRWFTPAVEVELCGHATLASAHALWETGRLDVANEARFHTRSGLLVARRGGEWIELDFPTSACDPADPPAGLREALGADVQFCGKTTFDYLLELADDDTVRGLDPDFRAMAKLPVRGVIVTARGSAPYDFVSRFFGPAAGIDEDPATGSAHCALGPYWSAKLGKDDLLAWQASARGAEIRVRPQGSRVLLSGRCVTTLRGELA